MLWAVNVAILAAAALTADPPGHSAKPKNASVGWLDSLRRQLMQDNYDYLPPSSSESAETTPSKAAGEPVLRAKTTQYSSPKYSPPQYAPAKGGVDFVEWASTNHDIMYYMDELLVAGLGSRRKNDVLRPKTRKVSTIQPARVTKPTGPKTTVSKPTVPKAIDRKPTVPKPTVPKRTKQPVVTEPTPNVTLTVIRLGRRARRGGSGPRFVAEAGARGVALASVDGAPFPAFRLPADLRQYAHDPAYDLF